MTQATSMNYRPLETGVGNAVQMDESSAGGERQTLVAVSFDMVGYSRMICEDDIGTVERFRVLRSELIDPSIERYRGFVANTAGDSLLVVFVSATEAARCAIEVQRGVPTHDHNQEQGREHHIRFRVGIDVGEAIVDGTNLHGMGVITAVRLQAICPPGGICISRTVHEYVRNRLDVQFERLGVFELKNICRPTEAFVMRPEVGARQLETMTELLPPIAVLPAGAGL